jgi:hypothetical protein
MESKSGAERCSEIVRGTKQVDVQHAEAGVLYLVQVAAVGAQLLYRLSKNFLPKGIAQP